MAETEPQTIPILVATTRQPADDARTGFTSGRAGALSFADAAITVPPGHRPGAITYPGRSPDPFRQFTVKALERGLGASDFAARLDERIEAAAGAGTARPPAFVYVHGFNTDFTEGLFRHAQIARDFGVPGLPVCFSWASAGLPSAYLYDRESAQLARDGLAETLALVARSQVADIVVVGHSMGAAIVMEVLRDLSLAGRHDLLARLDTVVLAAPDIDEDLFYQQFRTLGRRPRSFVLFVSRRDSLLQASATLRGGVPRVGLGGDLDGLTGMGIVVLDLSDFSGWNLSTLHFEFATAPLVMNLIRDGAAARRALAEPDLMPLEQVIAEQVRKDEALRKVVHLPPGAAPGDETA